MASGAGVLIACEHWLSYHTDDEQRTGERMEEERLCCWLQVRGGGTRPKNTGRRAGVSPPIPDVSSFVEMGQEDERAKTHGSFGM